MRDRISIHRVDTFDSEMIVIIDGVGWWYSKSRHDWTKSVLDFSNADYDSAFPDKSLIWSSDES